ncbi:(Fe-S)-binding protein [Alicyclobacillus ferrooxydans]|uniref:Cysteine-rich domain-containing protein n=1 Tax=Alicyclobacillus ferrooxydans TaxID=471514 RepID=A0A0P9CZG1_9BACL|nr:hypothetical protein AN477_17580 [Alicyclobacillus ferrooxydans]
MRAALFVTCLADSFYPDVGKSVVGVLRALGVEVTFPEGQTCCGQVTFNSGYWADTKAAAKRFIEVFEHEEYVVMPSGSCASMVREQYPQLLDGEPGWADRALSTAARVYEFSEFLVKVVGLEKIHATYHGTATYHTSCHMTRQLQVVDEPLAVLSRVNGLQLVPLRNNQDCCGFGGTFSVKLPEVSAAMADEKLQHMAETKADFVIASDLGCMMHLTGRAARQTHAGATPSSSVTPSSSLTPSASSAPLPMKHVAQVLAEGGLV